MHFKVIVIGAGLAGLSAVGRLNELGVTKSLILEARKDVGGRVRMIDFAGSRFNIGPEWLHGQESNPIYSLATNKLKLKTRDCDDYKFFFNKPLSSSVYTRERLFREKLKLLQEAVDDRLMTCDLNSLDKRSIADILDLNKPKNDSEMNQFARYWAFNYENGSSASEYSALVYRLSSKIFENVPAFSDYCFVERNGFTKIVEEYALKANLDTENISLGDAVVQIDCSGNHVDVNTESGRRYSCDYCIFAAPSSVLSHDLVAITPRLDVGFCNAIKKTPFSTYTRVFAELSKDMIIPDFDWFVDLIGDCNDDIALWQNTRNDIPVLCAHVCQPKQNFQGCDIINRVNESLRNIFKDDFKSAVNVKTVSLVDNRYSFGAFPCANTDFNVDDVESLQKLGDESRLLFAGDSYDLEYFGTVQGAVSSGTRSAELIYRYMKAELQ